MRERQSSSRLGAYCADVVSLRNEVRRLANEKTRLEVENRLYRDLIRQHGLARLLLKKECRT